MLGNRIVSLWMTIYRYVTITGSPFRYFHFWKAIGNCTNWKFKLATVYWTEEEEEEQILDRKAQKRRRTMMNARQSYCVALDDYLSVTGSPLRYFHF